MGQKQWRKPIMAFGAAVVAVLAISTFAAVALTTSTQGWSTYRNAKYGFQLTYPGGLFVTSQEKPPTENGALWVSTDGSARLLATAAANETNETVQSYKNFVLKETYADAEVDYAPIKNNWFVLSGRKGDTIFYERITFVCGGKFIYGWQMNYPVSQRRKYDPIVEAVHRSYKPGRGEGGDCN